MRERWERAKNTVAARVFERTSALADSHPGLLKLFVDEPALWHIVDTTADNEYAWREFPPDKRSGLRVWSYASRAIIRVGRKALIDEATEFQGAPAAAFRLGHLALASELGDAVTEQEGEDVLVSMGIGRTGPLIATVGTFRADHKLFIPIQAEEPLVVARGISREGALHRYPQAIRK